DRSQLRRLVDLIPDFSPAVSSSITSTDEVEFYQRQSPDYWKSVENRKAFIAFLGRHFNINGELKQWYSVTVRSVRECGGMGFLDFFKDSMHAALVEAHPEFPWKPWLFERVPLSFWSRRENELAFLEWLEKELGIKDKEQWYN